jgi:hypothetical protein
MRVALLAALLALASCSQGLGTRCTGDSDCPSPLRCELRGRPRGVCTYSAVTTPDATRPTDLGVERPRDHRGEGRVDTAHDTRPPAPDLASDQPAAPDLARDQAAEQ